MFNTLWAQRPYNAYDYEPFKAHVGLITHALFQAYHIQTADVDFPQGESYQNGSALFVWSKVHSFGVVFIKQTRFDGFSRGQRLDWDCKDLVVMVVDIGDPAKILHGVQLTDQLYQQTVCAAWRFSMGNPPILTRLLNQWVPSPELTYGVDYETDGLSLRLHEEHSASYEASMNQLFDELESITNRMLQLQSIASAPGSTKHLELLDKEIKKLQDMVAPLRGFKSPSEPGIRQYLQQLNQWQTQIAAIDAMFSGDEKITRRTPLAQQWEDRSQQIGQALAPPAVPSEHFNFSHLQESLGVLQLELNQLVEMVISRQQVAADLAILNQNWEQCRHKLLDRVKNKKNNAASAPTLRIYQEIPLSDVPTLQAHLWETLYLLCDRIYSDGHHRSYYNWQHAHFRLALITMVEEEYKVLNALSIPDHQDRNRSLATFKALHTYLANIDALQPPEIKHIVSNAVDNLKNQLMHQSSSDAAYLQTAYCRLHSRSQSGQALLEPKASELIMLIMQRIQFSDTLFANHKTLERKKIKSKVSLEYHDRSYGKLRYELDPQLFLLEWHYLVYTFLRNPYTIPAPLHEKLLQDLASKLSCRHLYATSLSLDFELPELSASRVICGLINELPTELLALNPLNKEKVSLLVELAEGLQANITKYQAGSQFWSNLYAVYQRFDVQMAEARLGITLLQTEIQRRLSAMGPIHLDQEKKACLSSVQKLLSLSAVSQDIRDRIKTFIDRLYASCSTATDLEENLQHLIEKYRGLLNGTSIRSKYEKEMIDQALKKVTDIVQEVDQGKGLAVIAGSLREICIVLQQQLSILATSGSLNQTLFKDLSEEESNLLTDISLDVNFMDNFLALERLITAKQKKRKAESSEGLHPYKQELWRVYGPRILSDVLKQVTCFLSAIDSHEKQEAYQKILKQLGSCVPDVVKTYWLGESYSGTKGDVFYYVRWKGGPVSKDPYWGDNRTHIPVREYPLPGQQQVAMPVPASSPSPSMQDNQEDSGEEAMTDSQALVVTMVGALGLTGSASSAQSNSN